MSHTEENELTRAARVAQRELLGNYYRDLSTNYQRYHDDAKVIGPTLAWPFKPSISDFENL